MNWQKFQWEKVKLILWGAVGGAIITAIVGFNWGGWVTDATAQKLAQQKATEEVVNRLTPICIAQFDQDSEKEQKLQELVETNARQRRSYVEKQSWAIMPGDTKPDRKVAEVCAEQIVQITQATP